MQMMLQLILLCICKLEFPTEVMWLNVDDECVTGSELVLMLAPAKKTEVWSVPLRNAPTQLLACICLLGLHPRGFEFTCKAVSQQTTDVVH